MFSWVATIRIVVADKWNLIFGREDPYFVPTGVEYVNFPVGEFGQNCKAFKVVDVTPLEVCKHMLDLLSGKAKMHISFFAFRCRGNYDGLVSGGVHGELLS